MEISIKSINLVIGVSICILFLIHESSAGGIDLKLPRCTNTTLQPNQYKYSASSDDITVIVGPQPVTVHNFSEPFENAIFGLATTVCYPLSPQLLNCPTTSTFQYVLAPNLTLLSSETNMVLADLGDYIINGNDSAEFCTTPIRPLNNEPRCNSITLQRTEIHITDGGAWLLNASGEILPRPQFLIGDQSAASDTNDRMQPSSYQVCWPLTIPFINCPVKWILNEHNYKQRDDHQLLVTLNNRVLGIGEYFLSDDNAIVCEFTDVDQHSHHEYSSIYSVYTGFYILSSVCLLFTVIYQLMAPKLTYHTRCLLCHVISMFVMYIGLSLRKYISDIPISFCYTLYVVVYVAALSAFFWLNVLSFDVWQFFSTMQTARFRMPIRLCAHNRFSCYSWYAWGAPVLLCALSVLVDQVRSVQKALGIFPGITKMCWFNERPALWAFYYGPLAALMAFNLFYFVMTVLNLKFASSGTEIINRKRNKQLFFVCLKLFVVMGLSWMAEVFTWIITSDQNFNYYWYFSNIFTSLQGVAIFIVYVGKMENFHNLRRRLCPDSSKASFTAFPEFSKANVSYSESGMSDVTSVSTMSLPDSFLKEKENGSMSVKKIESLK